MRSLILTILLALITLSVPVSTTQAQRPQQDVLRCNPMTDKWTYEQPNSQLKYNPIIETDSDDDRWTYEEPKSRLRYNPMSDQWNYAR